MQRRANQVWALLALALLVFVPAESAFAGPAGTGPCQEGGAKAKPVAPRARNRQAPKQKAQQQKTKAQPRRGKARQEPKSKASLKKAKTQKQTEMGRRKALKGGFKQVQNAARTQKSLVRAAASKNGGTIVLHGNATHQLVMNGDGKMSVVNLSTGKSRGVGTGLFSGKLPYKEFPSLTADGLQISFEKAVGVGVAKSQPKEVNRRLTTQEGAERVQLLARTNPKAIAKAAKAAGGRVQLYSNGKHAIVMDGTGSLATVNLKTGKQARMDPAKGFPHARFPKLTKKQLVASFHKQVKGVGLFSRWSGTQRLRGKYLKQQAAVSEAAEGVALRSELNMRKVQLAVEANGGPIELYSNGKERLFVDGEGRLGTRPVGATAGNKLEIIRPEVGFPAEKFPELQAGTLDKAFKSKVKGVGRQGSMKRLRAKVEKRRTAVAEGLQTVQLLSEANYPKVQRAIEKNGGPLEIHNNGRYRLVVESSGAMVSMKMDGSGAQMVDPAYFPTTRFPEMNANKVVKTFRSQVKGIEGSSNPKRLRTQLIARREGIQGSLEILNVNSQTHTFNIEQAASKGGGSVELYKNKDYALRMGGRGQLAVERIGTGEMMPVSAEHFPIAFFPKLQGKSLLKAFHKKVKGVPKHKEPKAAFTAAEAKVSEVAMGVENIFSAAKANQGQLRQAVAKKGGEITLAENKRYGLYMNDKGTMLMQSKLSGEAYVIESADVMPFGAFPEVTGKKLVKAFRKQSRIKALLPQVQGGQGQEMMPPPADPGAAVASGQ